MQIKWRTNTRNSPLEEYANDGQIREKFQR